MSDTLTAAATIHVVDDDEAVRRSLALLLGSFGHATRTYASAEDLLAGLDVLEPGCAVIDIRMPGMDGLALQHALQARGSTMPIVIVTGHADVAVAVQAMKAGAVDFIEKPFEEQAILDAVRAALERCGDEGDGDRAAVVGKLALLSERERQVLDGLISGHANKTIAHNLGISPRTVEVYRANLMAKMQAKSLSELIRMAILADVRPAGRAG